MGDSYLNYVYNVKSDCVHFANVLEQSVELHILMHQVTQQLPTLKLRKWVFMSLYGDLQT